VKLSSVAARVILFIVLGATLLLALGPAVWVFVSSFKTSTQTLSGQSPFWPSPFTLEGFTSAFDLMQWAPFANTFLYAAGGAAGAVVAALLAAYPLTRFPVRGGGMLVVAYSLALAVPVVGLATPEFFVMRTLGLLNSQGGMVLFYAAIFFPISFVILRAFLAGLPSEMEEAAVMDGAGYWRILLRIVAPLATPALATAGVVAFVGIWNEFFYANLLISSIDVQNIQTALAAFKGQFRFNASAVLAGTSVSMLVPITIFLLLQKYVISGLTAGATK
jgi:raffinose/stachyose/melibiose transport system permease protein